MRVDGVLKEGPVLRSTVDLAKATGLSLTEFDRLTYGQINHGIDHYHHFKIPKRSGGYRQLSSPSPELRQIQEWILNAILVNVIPHEAAAAYCPGRSVAHNAWRHASKGTVVRMDLLDFFPSITFRRVRETFASLGYEQKVAMALALLTTTGTGPSVSWHLPQGACTSPALSNIVTFKLDDLLTRMAQSLGYDYRRYADDLVFSHPARNARVKGLLGDAGRLVAAQEFRVNERKTRIMRSPQRQMVTGLVVNSGPRISRRDLRRFRAFLHRCELQGCSTVSEEVGKDARSVANGYLGYVQMVNPEQAERIRMRHPKIFPT